MPLEMQDIDEADSVGRDPRRFGPPPNPWWRPQGTWGRMFLGTAALILVVGLAITVHLFKNFLERDPRFRIAGTDNIQATGLAEVTRAEMLPVFGEDVGRNIFFVPLAERRRQLEQIPWVEQATVMRLLPDQIHVAIVERQPVAFVRHGQQIGLVDANGVLLDMPAAVMAQRHYSFPVLTGIDGRDPLASRKARVALYLRLMHDLDADGRHFSDQISEIDLTDPEDARVLMPEQGTDILAHFGQDHFLERFQRYQAHIAEWRQQYPRLAEVDLRYERQIVLEMAPGAATEQTSVSAADGKPSPATPVQKPAVKGVTTAAHAKSNPVRSRKSGSVERAASRMRAKRIIRQRRENAIRAAQRHTSSRTAPGSQSSTAGRGR